MGEGRAMNKALDEKRTYGEHLTPVEIFEEFILPSIKKQIDAFRWVDLFAGKGSLILPMLNLVSKQMRSQFFQKHIRLFDVQEEMVKKAIENAISYGVSQKVARTYIQQRNTLENYPTSIFNSKLPVFHITNPPYLYLGYISKHEETREKYLRYFQGVNEGYQDLYQIALINDLRNGIKRMIYFTPTNFIFGDTVSNNIRDDFLRYYTIKKAIVFERPIFKHTGTNVMISFFKRKPTPKHESFTLSTIKIDNQVHKLDYTLKPGYHYRAGTEFKEFTDHYKAAKPLHVEYYLKLKTVNENQGDNAVKVIDSNSFTGETYEKETIQVNKKLFNKITSNILFIRTLDTGSKSSRAGLYRVKEVFETEGILVSESPYRTHPIQVFLHSTTSKKEQVLLKHYVNLLLEYFREKTDSAFLTTYKYSDSDYTRKYLGLTQAKALIKTFPILTINKEKKEKLSNLITEKKATQVLSLVKKVNVQKDLRFFR